MSKADAKLSRSEILFRPVFPAKFTSSPAVASTIVILSQSMTPTFPMFLFEKETGEAPGGQDNPFCEQL